MRKHLLLQTKKMPILIRPFLGVASFLSYSAGLSPRSSHDTSLTSRASSAEAVPAHLAPFSTKRMDREFERKLQEVFVSVQLEKVRKIYTCLLLARWKVSASSVLQDGSRAIMIFLRSQQFTTSINNNLFFTTSNMKLDILPLEQRTASICELAFASFKFEIKQ